MKITKSQLLQIIQEELESYLTEKKTFSSWRQAIKADAGLGTMDDVVSIGDLGDHGKALDRSEYEQVAAGADPADVKIPHMKRKEYLKKLKRKKEREARKKALKTESYAMPEMPCPEIPRSDGLNSDVETINSTLKPLGLQLYLTTLESLPAQLKLEISKL